MAAQEQEKQPARCDFNKTKLDVDLDISDSSEDVDLEVIEIKKKPNFCITSITDNTKLMHRASDFLKQMKQSNEELESKIQAMGSKSVVIERDVSDNNEAEAQKEHATQKSEDADDDANEKYINLDLYLGVLEEKSNANESNHIQQTTDKLLGIADALQKPVVIVNDADGDDVDTKLQ